jgi:hypothetical protein
MALFSLPVYPGATAYSLMYSDPAGADPNAPNPLGPWTNLGTGTITSPSDIIDPIGNQNLRLYRAAPIVSINGTSVAFPFYEPFSVAMSDPGVFESRLFDPQITVLLPSFRAFVGDEGVQQVCSTQINLDSGAGQGLLQPDGATTTFNLADVPDAIPAVVLEGSVKVIQNAKTLLLNTDYYVVYDAGQVAFKTAPAASDVITITYKEVTYTNRVLNGALANAIERLPGLGVNGYGTTFDNNVCLVTNTIGDTGLRYIIFLAAQKIINQAVIWAKAQAARAYKTGDFSMDTAPGRILDGMSKQASSDFLELKDAVDKYVRTTTHGVSYGDFDSFLSIQGLLPTWSVLFTANAYAGYWI